MKSEILELEKDNAVALYNSGSVADRDLLEKLYPKTFPGKITDRVKNFDDVLRIKGTTLEKFNEACKTAGLSPDEIGYRKNKLIVEVLNEGWVPDYSDSSQYKYYPWMKYAGSGFSFYLCVDGASSSSVASRLVLKSQALAEYYGRQFSAEINEYWL